jgi:DNA invertase Pin-like site-specific DNA recombinase
MSQEINFVDRIKAEPSQIRYCLYARKSSEDDERQALSIDSQVKEMIDLAQAEGLLVTDIRRESHSAKSSSTRPVFNELVRDVRKGLFSGILTWSPDRMSRNAGDLGLLVDLMDNGYLKEIRTHSQALTNSPNDKFLLMILCSQENDNRGVNVKRGQRAKCEMGVRPNLTPLGYLNDHYSGKGQKKVFQDPDRAPIIKQMFEKAVYEGYSGRKIYDWLKNETNFRSRGGYVLGLSNIYKILNNPYYCGLFSFSGKWYKGSYEPIITRELFDAVQKKMIVAPKSKPGTKQFDFTRLFKCGACGSGITAQERVKRLKSGGLKSYVYYHCTQFRNYDCREPYIREESLIEQLSSILRNISIPEILSRPILKPELDKFMLIHRRMQDQNDSKEIQPDFDPTGFIEYIFRDGIREQKRELIGCLNKTIYIKEKQIYIELLKKQH